MKFDKTGSIKKVESTSSLLSTKAPFQEHSSKVFQMSQIPLVCILKSVEVPFGKNQIRQKELPNALCFTNAMVFSSRLFERYKERSL